MKIIKIDIKLAGLGLFFLVFTLQTIKLASE